MALFDILKATAMLIKGVYVVTVAIRDSKNVTEEVRQLVGHTTNDLNVVGGLVENLQNFAQRVSPQSEPFLIKNVNILHTLVTNAQTVLENIQRDRHFLKRLFVNNNEYQQQLRDISENLHKTCVVINTALPTLDRIQIDPRHFENFRRIYDKIPEKTLSFYDFSIVNSTPQSASYVDLEDFDTRNRLCYLKLGNNKFFFAYKLRAWSVSDPKQIVLAQRRAAFRRNLPAPAEAIALPILDHVPANGDRERLDFSEFFKVYDDICGMALTESFIYIATKYQITVVSSTKKNTVAQYGTEGNGPNTFQHISYIYIPPNDNESLYIVDRGQCVVHHYRVNSSSTRFEHIRTYFVIANLKQANKLISCTIYNRHLYVSDNGNNCLHVFPLNGQRQDFYLTANPTTPFSPGSLYANDEYLFVADCSEENPGIILFNRQNEVVSWFRNPSLNEILAFDIDPQLNELYILTSTIVVAKDGKKTKQPLIVSMDSIIRNT